MRVPGSRFNHSLCFGVPGLTLVLVECDGVARRGVNPKACPCQGLAMKVRRPLRVVHTEESTFRMRAALVPEAVDAQRWPKQSLLESNLASLEVPLQGRASRALPKQQWSEDRD